VSGSRFALVAAIVTAALGCPSSGAAQTPSPLVGRWQSPDSVVQINADGTLSIDGTGYRYTVQGRVLTLVGYDGSVAIPFQLTGDTLSVLLNGQPVTLQRILGDRPSGRAGQAGAPERPGASGSGIADLVGKWCDVSNVTANSGGRVSDECFTVFANGGFTYHRETSSSGSSGSAASTQDDRGTVSLSGTVLTVRSQSQATRTYQLVKRNHPKTRDPMICLDGQCFVTYGPRAPWR
jgi:hypothetical protein